MGISRNVFSELDFKDDFALKDSLFKKIRKGDFADYLRHLTPEQFFVSICLGKKPIGFP